MAAKPMRPLDVTEIKLGGVTFHSPELERHCGDEYVRFYICTEVVIREPLSENNGKPILVDRRTWDEMAQAAARIPTKEVA